MSGWSGDSITITGDSTQWTGDGFNGQAGGLSGVASVVTGANGNLTIAAGFSANAVVSEAATATFTNYASVTLAAPLYTGIGSILDPNAGWSNGSPGIGNVVFYDPTNITILSNGEIVSAVAQTVALALWNNSGTWSEMLILVTQGPVSYATVSVLAAGALTTAIRLLGAANAATAATGDIGPHAALQGNAPVTTSAGGSLSTKITLQSAVSALTSSAALLSTQISLLGAALTATSSTGDVKTATGFKSSAIAVTAATGALLTAIRASANASTSTTVSASLNTGALLSANPSDTTAAGADLLTQIRLLSSLADVTTSVGTLTAQILFSANAAELSSIVAGLSSTQPIAGGASVTTTATADLFTSLAAFGFAKVFARSQTGIQSSRSVYIEQSACVIIASFFDALGDKYTPASIQYRVDDILSGNNLVAWTPIGTGQSVFVVVTPLQNTLVSLSRPFETHQVLFKIIDGSGSAFYARVSFELLRAVGATN